MRERRHTAMRMCVGCRRTRPRDELARLARTPGGLRHDSRRRAQGRGANICPSLTCIDAAGRRGAAPLRRALRGATESEIHAALDELRREIAGSGPAVDHPDQNCTDDGRDPEMHPRSG